MYPQNTCLESDWKLFRKRVPVWQERYMGRLIEEYRAILESEESSSEKIWALEKQIRQDKKAPGVIVDMRRSTMRLELMQILFQGVIQPSDLEGFSQELRDGLTFVMQKYSGQGVWKGNGPGRRITLAGVCAFL